MPFTRENLCPGYLPNHTGQGRCCCGLHWSGTMPVHTAGGVELSERQVALLEMREMERVVIETNREKTRRELRETRRLQWRVG